MSRTGTRQPITRPRSEWTRLPDTELGGMVVQARTRTVHDGHLRVLIGDEPTGLHLSISWAPHSQRQAPRYPTWDEIADARDQLLPPDRTFAMLLPASDEYVAVHDTTFHLHELAEQR